MFTPTIIHVYVEHISVILMYNYSFKMVYLIEMFKYFNKNIEHK